MKRDVPEGWTEVVFNPGDHLVEFRPGRGFQVATSVVFWLAENCGFLGEDYTYHIENSFRTSASHNYSHVVVICLRDKAKALLCRLSL